MINNHLSILFLIFYHVFFIFCEVYLISNHLYYIIVLKMRKKKITMNKERHSEIGAKIKSLREKNNMEQLELASRMGYKSQSTISKWESGVNLPTGKKLIELAKLLNTTTNEILGIDTSSPRTDNPAIAGDSHVNESDDIDKIIDRAMFFDGKPLTDDDRRALRGIISGYMNSKGD